MARDTGDPAWRGSSFPPGRGPAVASRRLVALAVTGILILVVAAVARGALSGGAVTPRPGVAWVLSPASNTVAIRLTPGGGPAGRRTEARSHLTVIEHENGSRPLRRRSKDGGTVRVPVPPGRQTRLLVRVKGPQPFDRTLTVTVPPALRVLDSGPVSGGLLLSLSGPLRRPHRPLCGQDKVSFPGRSRVAVARSPYPCTTRLRLTAVDGEQAVLPVTVPALPEVPLYSFASSADRAIYITVDDGWTPSREVLAIMRRTHLPVTAFLIQQAAQENLPYWRAFVQAGGMVGDHTVSHPNLTKLSLGSATVQWGEARRTLGQWFGRAPVLGRPPYGAFNPVVAAAAYRGGLKTLVGWSATADSDGIHTWNGRRLEPGEIVLLHWVPGLGHQLTKLLKVIRARHLNPLPLSPASFAGITPQTHSLDGD
jgi:peptidoglycan/xylan/chitin deacetylase (PgdA/CDA1 family)